MKSLILLTLLFFCMACGPLGQPEAEPSPARTAAQTSHAATQTVPFVPPTETHTPLPPPPTPIFEILVDNVATGPQGELYATGFGAYGNDARHYAQWQGTDWIGLGSGFQTAGNALAVDSLGHLYTESLKESDQGLATAMMRWDGARWEDISGNFGTVVDVLKAGRLSSNIPVVALAMDGEDHLYAAGAFFYPGPDFTAEFPMGYVAKWDKDTWTVLGGGFDQVNILALAVGPTGEVYVAGEQPRTPDGNSSFIAHWDGETWTQIDTSRLNTSGDLALDRAGGLYVGSIMSEPSGSIEYWDGTDWRTIPTRLGGEAPAILDMAVDANGHPCIGGTFETVNGIPARYIACWDGSSWQALGDGFDRQVNALAFDAGGDLYAAGFFTAAGGLPVQHVARWDGERWHALEP